MNFPLVDIVPQTVYSRTYIESVWHRHLWSLYASCITFHRVLVEHPSEENCSQYIVTNRRPGMSPLVAIPCRVILGTDDQTATLLCSTVDGLDDVDQLLLVLKHPIQLIVVAS
jgi:hypothetical protein